MADPSIGGFADDSVDLFLNCIDLSSPDEQRNVSLLKQACSDCGFFYVVNHGISQELINEVFSKSKSFFNMPINQKMKFLKNHKNRGYTPLFDETLDPANQLNGDYKEGYYIGVEVPEDHPEANEPFYGPNVWPTEDLLPEWRSTMDEFHKQALIARRTHCNFASSAL